MTNKNKLVSVLASSSKPTLNENQSPIELISTMKQTVQMVRASFRDLRYATKVLSSSSDLNTLRLDLVARTFTTALSLSNQLDVADNISLQLKYAMKGLPDQAKAYSTVTQLQDYLDKKLNECMGLLATYAREYMPKVGRDIFKSLTATQVSKLEKLCTKVKKYTYLTTNEEGTLPVFTHYLECFGLKEDSGFTHPTYYIITTMILVDGVPELYVNTASYFMLPTKFRLGVRATVDNLNQIVSELMASENFSELTPKVALPIKVLNPNSFTSKKHILDVTVDNHKIQVKLVLGLKADKLLAIVKRITQDIKGVLSTAMTGFTLKYHTKYVGRNYHIIYSLVMPTESPIVRNTITLNQLEQLKLVGFDDLDIARLHQVLLTNERR